MKAFETDILIGKDYYPFGMQLIGRNWAIGNNYRFGFQNQEIDGEFWEGAVSFEYRIEDPRLGRFFSVDPLFKKYCFDTPYGFSENRLICMRELEGLETVNASTGETVQEPFTSEASLDATGESSSDWQDLIDYKPPGELVEAAGHRVDDFYVQNIADAKSDNLNLDYYSVTITKLPDGFETPGDYLQHIRANFSSYTDSNDPFFTTDFEPYNENEGANWADPGAYGNIMTFEMHTGPMNPDDGSVMLSARETNYWIFTTVHTDLDDQHPVSGNRMFGITTNYDIEGNIVSYTFFTRGADRPTGNLDKNLNMLVFEGAQHLWNDVTRNIVKEVNSSGGQASSGISWSKRVQW